MHTNLEISFFPNPSSDFIKQLSMNFSAVSRTVVETWKRLNLLQRELPSNLLEKKCFLNS